MFAARRLTVIAIAFISLTGCIANMQGNKPMNLFDPYAIGARHLREGSPGPALVTWQQAAKDDNCNAQFALANMYAEGRYIKQDWVVAEQWWTAAAKQGHVMAQQQLMQLYIADGSHPICKKRDCPTETKYDEAYQWAKINEMLIAKLGANIEKKSALFEYEEQKASPAEQKVIEVLTLLDTKVSSTVKDEAEASLSSWKPEPKLCHEFHL